MRNHRYSRAKYWQSALALAIGLTIPVATASAQRGTAGQEQAGVSARMALSGGVLGISAIGNFADRVNWDPAKRGPLLIVSPEEQTGMGDPYHLREVSKDKPMPQPEANGNYDLKAIADYFDRKPVGFHSLTILTPISMTQLNDRRLFKPNAYVAMSAGAKLRLLESTLTPEQWERLCSPNGIGAGDLSGEQSEIYLSLLPDPFCLAGQNYVTLTPEQRAGVRLSFVRQLDWSLLIASGNTRFFPNHSSSISAARPLYTLQPVRGGEETSTVFGVPLTEEEPNRVKKSELPESLQGSETVIALGADRTVGELLHRIGAALGAELYADPRYAERSLYVRSTVNQGAQAGDLLRALALAVTGTWRRVGMAYVLTDDIEGLGVRHARIADWIARTALLGQVAEAQAATALIDVREIERASWSDADPMRPDATLIRKLEAAPKQQTNTGFVPAGVFAALGELPAAVQTEIKEEYKLYADAQSHEEALGHSDFRRAPLRTDGVNISMSVHSSYIIPGLASVSAEGSQPLLVTDTPSSHFGYSRLPPIIPNAEPILFPRTSPKMRALMIAPKSKEEVTNAVQEAHRCGFNQLWIQTPRNDTALLPLAIHEANGLTIQAVVRPLQAVAADPMEAHDCTLTGETTLEYVRRRRVEMREFRIPDADSTATQQLNGGLFRSADGRWCDASASEALVRSGDYLRPDDAGICQQLAADISKLAATPGLAGLVLRDAIPAGYQKDRPEMRFPIASSSIVRQQPINDPILRLGYSEVMRLACLRKFGFDPIDLSPLPEGDHLAMLATPSATIKLPLFRDLGQSGQVHNGAESHDPVLNGARERQAQWQTLRTESNATALRAVVDAVHKEAPRVTLSSSFEGRDSLDFFWIGSIDSEQDKPVKRESVLQKTVTTDDASSFIVPKAPSVPVALRSRTNAQLPSPSESAKEQSKTAYCVVAISTVAPDVAGADAEAIARLRTGLPIATGWDGVVVDLTALPPMRAALVLRAMGTQAETQK